MSSTHSTSQPTLQKALPELPFTDVPAGVEHFRDVLGFKVNFAIDTIGVMDRDRIRILLVSRTEQHKGIGSCYVYVDNVDQLYEELKSKGANVEAPPVDRPWGLREFRVFDPERNIVTFGQPFE